MVNANLLNSPNTTQSIVQLILPLYSNSKTTTYRRKSIMNVDKFVETNTSFEGIEETNRRWNREAFRWSCAFCSHHQRYNPFKIIPRLQRGGGEATTMKSIRPTGRIADISWSTIAGLSAVRQSRLVNSLSHTNGWASVATDARAHRTLHFSFLRINTTFQRTLRILPFYRRVVLHTRESSFNRILLRDFVI